MGRSTVKGATKSKSLKPEWLKFIEEMIIHGDKTLAYENAFPGKRSKAVNQSSGGHLMRRPEIYTPLVEYQERQRIELAKRVAEVHAVNDTILTKVRKLEILSGIAEGTSRVQKITFNKKTGEPVVVDKLPDNADKMKAIEIHSKLVGDLAPIKSTITDERLPAEFSDLTEKEIRDLLTKHIE